MNETDSLDDLHGIPFYLTDDKYLYILEMLENKEPSSEEEREFLEDLAVDLLLQHNDNAHLGR